MIIEIIKAIWSFLVIITMLVIGFSLVFYQFNRKRKFTTYLLITFNLIYSNSDPSDFSPSQLVYFVIVTVLLAVILLNMLIAIMTDTYDRVQGTSVLAEGKEKISLIFEATMVMRTIGKCFTRKKNVEKKIAVKTNKVLRRLNFDEILDEQDNFEDKDLRDSTKGYLFYVHKVEKDYEFITNFYEWSSKLSSDGRKAEAESLLLLDDEVSEITVLKMHCKELRGVVDEQASKLQEVENFVKASFEELDKKLMDKLQDVMNAVQEAPGSLNEEEEEVIKLL